MTPLHGNRYVNTTQKKPLKKPLKASCAELVTWRDIRLRAGIAANRGVEAAIFAGLAYAVGNLEDQSRKRRYQHLRRGGGEYFDGYQLRDGLRAAVGEQG